MAHQMLVRSNLTKSKKQGSLRDPAMVEKAADPSSREKNSELHPKGPGVTWKEV